MYEIIKRLVDIIFALLALLLLSVILLPIMILLLLTGEHEVFYLQDRVGYKNKIFRIWKLATMLKVSPSIGSGSITLKNDPRVTRVGRYLRKLKINELPQLVNILKADMTLVGPRPLMPVDFAKYPEHIQKVVYNTRPGLTGIASLVFRDEEKYFSATEMDPHEFDKFYVMPYKGKLEEWYRENKSFLLDIKIIIFTACILLFPHADVFRFFKTLPRLPRELSSLQVEKELAGAG